MEGRHSGQRDLLERHNLFVCCTWGFSLEGSERTRLQYRRSPLRHLVVGYLFYDAEVDENFEKRFLDKGEKVSLTRYEPSYSWLLMLIVDLPLLQKNIR